MVWNLLTNAIKFTPKGGQVQVLLQRVNSHLELSVSDTGIGIPASFLPHVFDRFSQRDSSTTRGFGGLGLGLAISKQLVELHGGTIRVDEPGRGPGCDLLRRAAALDRAAGGRELAPRPSHRRDASPESSSPLPQLDGVHVFVVDDEPDAREILERILRDQGAQVTSFGSAEEVLAALKTTKPTVLISDIGMPEMDGYQFMRALRAGESRASGAFLRLALTAFARAEDRKRSLLAGYQAHLAKPFDVGELILRGRRPGRKVGIGSAGRAEGPEIRLPDVQVRRLRLKLESDAAHPGLILTARCRLPPRV